MDKKQAVETVNEVRRTEREQREREQQLERDRLDRAIVQRAISDADNGKYAPPDRPITGGDVLTAALTMGISLLATGGEGSGESHSRDIYDAAHEQAKKTKR